MAAVTFTPVGGSSAVEVWMPETGEVALEALPRDDAAALRQHACALLGAGQYAGGSAILRKLIEEDPSGDWVPAARYTLARGLVSAGRGREAFDELQALLDQPPAGVTYDDLRRWQFTAARVEATTDVDRSARLYDRLFDTAKAKPEAIRAVVGKADVLFEARRYMEAQTEYLFVLEHFSSDERAAYCAYQAAECDWRIANWLDLGLERVKTAEQSYQDFVEAFPGDVRAAEAVGKRKVIRAEQARLYRDVAAFYIQTERRPWAAEGYLEMLVRDYAGTPQAEWAAGELQRLKGTPGAMPREGLRALAVPGVSRRTGGP